MRLTNLFNNIFIKYLNISFSKPLNRKFPTEIQRCRIIRSVTTGIYAVYLSTAGCEIEVASTVSRDILLVCLVCLLRLWCAATMFTKYCRSRALEKLSSLCAKLILNRDQLVKYFGFPLPELEIIYPICAKGCRIFRR